MALNQNQAGLIQVFDATLLDWLENGRPTTDEHGRPVGTGDPTRPAVRELVRWEWDMISARVDTLFTADHKAREAASPTDHDLRAVAVREIASGKLKFPATPDRAAATG